MKNLTINIHIIGYNLREQSYICGKIAQETSMVRCPKKKRIFLTSSDGDHRKISYFLSQEKFPVDQHLPAPQGPQQRGKFKN